MESIAICICTYKRHKALHNLLENLSLINRPADCKIDIIVVDNDPLGSASHIKYEFGEIQYFIESKKGVSFARNRAIREANKLDADIIAFLDDDEVPTPNWLIHMYFALKNYNADIVAGPVLTILPDELKAFLPFMTRKRHPTGTPVKYWGAGNVLLRAEVFDQIGYFSEAYAIRGGEDTDFSARCNKQGLRMIWSDEAIVTEPTNITRANSRWLSDRAYDKGRIIVKVERDLNFGSRKRRILIALTYLVLGMAAWIGTLIIDHLFKSNYRLVSIISFKKGLGMIEELCKRPGYNENLQD
ncbi:glycosyltransferase family 2 protein [Deinococcus aerolatus]|uniref:glycosyltransferase family 2 protein n=1 Tax=Deinococcus aerolatus TaxID=522487 RepID=UPI001664CC7C|nr:glycosyltransferase [Deinococcus aerolatus]